jgi:plasmid stabilization system protein ParE
MARIVYSAAALDDLERIVDFLAEAVSADAALVAIEQIRTAVAVLAKHPRIGRRTNGTMRELVISHGSSGYLALYRLSRPEVVRILRIRHQRDAGYRD